MCVLQNDNFTLTHINIKEWNQESIIVKYVIKYFQQNIMQIVIENHMNQKPIKIDQNPNFNAHSVAESMLENLEKVFRNH